MSRLHDKRGVRYFRSVLLSDLPAFIAAGWVDTGKRDRKPSVSEPIALVEWGKDGAPPLSPEALDREQRARLLEVVP